MKRFCVPVVTSVLCLAAGKGSAQREADSPRRARSLNGEWSVTVAPHAEIPPSQADWDTVTVPGLRQGPAAGGSSDAWYRRRARIPGQWGDTRIFIKLWGARFAPRVYVNGRKVGSRIDGWTPFEVEITEDVVAGEEFRLDVACQDWGAAFADGFELPESASGDLRRSKLVRGKIVAPVGGHYRMYGLWDDVELLARPAVYLDDLVIETSVREGRLGLRGVIRGGESSDWRVAAVVRDGGKAVLSLPSKEVGPEGRWSLQCPFSNAHFWSPEDPHLYDLELSLLPGNGGGKIDLLKQRFGFKELWAEGPNFIFNNVKRHLLATSGWPTPADQDYETVRNALRLMKEANCVAFRLHTQPWQHKWLEAADEEGIMIIEEGALWCDTANYAFKGEQLWQNIRDHLANMVRRDRNHASLVMWSIENEFLHCGADRYDPDIEEKLAQVGRFVKKLDPFHLITFEADLDPGGCADVIGLHYPHELPDFTDYPNTADWLDMLVTTGTGGGLLGNRHKDFRWRRRKPLYIGEYLWVPSGNYAPGTVFFGEDAYLDRSGYNRRAKALAWRFQTQAYRREGVSGLCPWTFLGRGGSIDTDDVLYKAQKESYVPVAAFPRELDTRFFGGAGLVRSFDVFNDSTGPKLLKLRTKLGQEIVESGEFELPPAGYRSVELNYRLPEVKQEESLPFSIELLHGDTVLHHTELHCSVSPLRPLSPPAGMRLKVYDPSGNWAPGLEAGRISELAGIRGCDPDLDLLIVAPKAVNPSKAPSAAPVIGGKADGSSVLVSFVNSGGRALILEQESLEGLPFSLSLVKHSSTFTFPLSGSEALTGGLGAGALRLWRDDHYVTRRELRRPAINGARTLIVSGGENELANGVLVDLRAGRGCVVFCQALVGTKLDSEPAARKMFVNLLEYLAGFECSKYTGPVPVLASESEFPKALRELGMEISAITDSSPGKDLLSSDLFVLHGGGDWEDPLRKFLRSKRKTVPTIYWHRPDVDAFERFKSLLGAERFSICPAQGPIARELDDHELFEGVSREELFFPGGASRVSWRSPVSPDPGIVDSCLGPATELDSDFRRFEAEEMQIEGKFVSVNEDGTGVLFSTRGTVGRSIDISRAGTYRAGLLAGGTPLDGVYPHARLFVNGKADAEVMLTEGDVRSYPTVLRLPRGSVNISIAFVNDRNSPTEDRNLFLDALLLDAEPFDLEGVESLVTPAAVAVVNVPARDELGPCRLVVDTIQWSRGGNGRNRGRRYASALFANLGASFFPPPVEPDWILPEHIQPVGTIPYFRKSGGEVHLVAAGTVEAEFICSESGTWRVVVRGRSKPAEGVFAIAKVEIDGLEVGETAVAATRVGDFRVGDVALDGGKHRLTLTYTNDLYSEGEDRNLYVSAVGFRKK